ncbi:phosphotransferase family protein [Fulvimarina sp. 2208YS6-2-32]|uniref:Phosphotransferase family protein n=1 Tax=Fulvimarina uroteuthidis TaxID=3098149 RepID=A0ABU5I727_9HYPH|nr:phosphotransferase family protein [Fulvimarina sp. 2208YS6-2-32]MDY8110619.1 phosphotransferase family protein [Fulvimarina sp. 2208YS6-2-32]
MRTDATNTGLGLDRDTLRRFLDARYGPSEAFDVQRIGGGQSNPTFRVGHGDRRMILRKQPPGALAKGAHRIDREYKAMEALASTDVPVPAMLLYHEDAALLGTPFYLMEEVDGRVFQTAAMEGATAQERARMYASLADTLARLHAVPYEEVGLARFGRSENYFGRQIALWSGQLEHSTGEPIVELERLARWLSDNQPADDGLSAIAHGDFRVGNMMYAAHGTDVVAVLDWELSTIGHPLADLAFCCMPWHTSSDEYGGILDLDAEALGIPDEASFVARYRETMPHVPAPEAFHLAFALFRFAVIFVGIADRARAGNAADPDALKYAPLARRFAMRALDVAAEK